MGTSTDRTTGEIAPYDQSRMREASELMLRARRTVTPIGELPPNLRPQTIEEAYHLQDLILASLGEVGGWKVGAVSPEATPLFAPMPAYTIARSGTLIANKFRRLRGVEAEIAFLMGRDLPPRAEPYSRDEVAEAIESCHPAIELMESAFFDPDAVDRLSFIGDLQIHGGFVYGEPVAGWRDFDFGSETVTLYVNSEAAVDAGRNAAGPDLLRLVVWLANEAQQRTGGLLAGQWITTGSWTGKTWCKRGDTAEASFGRFGLVTVQFE
jgi:2-keto-4-pentenoate hydratase